MIKLPEGKRPSPEPRERDASPFGARRDGPLPRGRLRRRAGEGVSRTFNDLLRRAQDLDALAHAPCLSHLAFRPLNFTH